MNILLLQLKRIGDLVLTTPAIAALREKFPQARISLVVSTGCAELLPAIAKVDEKLVVSRVPTWINVAHRPFDCCIDFTRNDRSSLLTRLSGAKIRVALDRRKQRSTFRSRAYNALVTAPPRDRHTIDFYLQLLQPLGIENPARKIELHIPDYARARAAELRSLHRIRDSFIVLHPGSARAEKFWEPQRWAEVIEHIRAECDLDLVLTGGKSAAERNHIHQIKSHLRGPVIDLTGQTDLLMLAALIADANLLVTVDSAPMHLAAAANTPQVALFGLTNPFHWRPLDSPALILQGDSPAPLREFSPNQSLAPMNQISTRAVIDAMDALLSSPTARGS